MINLCKRKINLGGDEVSAYVYKYFYYSVYMNCKTIEKSFYLLQYNIATTVQF